jgi:hypothetical protein
MQNHRKLIVLAGLVAMLLPGCYLGRSPGAKKVAYAGNGLLVVGGVAGIAGSAGDEQGVLTTISAIPLVVGLAGILLNLAVETREPPPPRAYSPSVALRIGTRITNVVPFAPVSQVTVP